MNKYKRILNYLQPLCFILMVIYLLTCKDFNITGKLDHSPVAAHELPSDTLLSVCAGSLPFPPDLSHPLHVDMKDFASFLGAFCNAPLQYEQVEHIDTTGDGMLETVKYSVEITEGKCLVRNTIIREGEVLWEDEMVIDDRYGAYLFGGVANYDSFYPYSAFYLGLVNAPFVDGLLQERHDFNERKKELLNKLTGSEDPAVLIKAHQSELASYLDQYKGQYIFSLNMAGRDIYIWDPYKKTFVPIYLS